MDIDYLIDRLEALIQTGKRVPLSNKVMLDEQECYGLIDQMRAVVPEEIKAAKRTLNDRERILDEADDTARQIIEQAEQERRMMIEQEGLLVEAERQRDIMLAEATQETYELRNHAQTLYDDAVNQTQEMREGANQYAMQVLQELETLLDKHLNVVRNGLTNFVQQSQNYQQQIDEYQRQYRPQYAPSKAEVAAQTRPQTSSRPRPAAPESEPAPERPANRPAPAANRPTELPVDRKPANSGPNPSRPAQPTNPPRSPQPNTNNTLRPAQPSNPSRPLQPSTNQPNSPAPAPVNRSNPPSNSNGASNDNRLTGRLNLVSPSPLRPVPKVSTPSTEPEDDFEDIPDHDFDFDEAPAPPRNGASGKPPPNPTNRPARPPF